MNYVCYILFNLKKERNSLFLVKKKFYVFISYPAGFIEDVFVRVGAIRSDCLVELSILNFFRIPMNCFFVHVSSTFEFGAIRSDCLVELSRHSFILNLFRSHMNVID